MRGRGARAPGSGAHRQAVPWRQERVRREAVRALGEAVHELLQREAAQVGGVLQRLVLDADEALARARGHDLQAAGAAPAGAGGAGQGPVRSRLGPPASSSGETGSCACAGAASLPHLRCLWSASGQHAGARTLWPFPSEGASWRSRERRPVQERDPHMENPLGTSVRPPGWQCVLRVHVGEDRTRRQIQGRRSGSKCLLGGGVIQSFEASKTTPTPHRRSRRGPSGLPVGYREGLAVGEPPRGFWAAITALQDGRKELGRPTPPHHL